MLCIQSLLEIDFSSFIKSYQTLIAGILAVGVGGWTIHCMRQQINQSENDRKDRLSRQANAAMIALPNAAAEIADYAKKVFNNLHSIWNDSITVYEPVPYPEKAFSVIRDFAAALPPNDQAIAFLMGLSRDLQVIESRTRDNKLEKRSRADKNFLEHTMIVVCQIHARASLFFDYTDPKTDRYKDRSPNTIEWVITSDKIKGALNTMTFAKNGYSKIRSTLENVIESQHTNSAS